MLVANFRIWMYLFLSLLWERLDEVRIQNILWPLRTDKLKAARSKALDPIASSASQCRIDFDEEKKYYRGLEECRKLPPRHTTTPTNGLIGFTLHRLVFTMLRCLIVCGLTLLVMSWVDVNLVVWYQCVHVCM